MYGVLERTEKHKITSHKRYIFAFSYSEKLNSLVFYSFKS